MDRSSKRETMATIAVLLAFRVLLVAVIVLLAAALTSCGFPGSALSNANGGGNNSEGKIVLNVLNYHVGADFCADYYSYLFESFGQTEAGRNVEFRFEEIPTADAFNQKIKLLISSGDLPDIVLSGGNSIVELAARSGKVADLTPFFDADPRWKALFDDRSLEFNTVDGRVYGVPVSREISYIYYNKELFAYAGVVPPETSFASWDDFFAACDAFIASGIVPVGMDTAGSGLLTNLWFSALIATQSEAGAAWMNTAYPTDFETPEVIGAARQLQKMFSEYTTPDAVGGKYDTMVAHFFSGEVAMFPNGPWMIPDFRSADKAPDGFYDNVGVMLMPGDGMVTEPMQGDMVGASDPAKIEVAVAFLKYSTSLANQIKALEMAGIQPISAQVNVPLSLRVSDPLMAEVLDIAAKAQITFGQNQAYWRQDVVDAFSEYLPELACGNLSAEQFCARLTAAAFMRLGYGGRGWADTRSAPTRTEGTWDWGRGRAVRAPTGDEGVAGGRG